MTEPAALQRLLTWLSPAFPVGAFAWSAGLETAISEGRVTDSRGLESWILGSMRHGGLRIDAIQLAQAWRAAGDSTRLRELGELTLALSAASERHKETLLTGDAFVAAARAWPSDIYGRLPDRCPYPIAVGAIAAAHGTGLHETVLGYLTAALQSQVSVAVRLVPLGQTDGLAVIAALEPDVAALTTEAAAATLDDIGGIGYAADIAQMRHETLESRIFRS